MNLNSKVVLAFVILLIADFSNASRRQSYSDRRSRGRGRGISEI